MIFSCTKDNLQKGLAVVSHLPKAQVNLPVLQNVHIKAEGGSVVLSTTNLERTIRVKIRGKVDQQGEFTVPARLFFDYVNLLDGDRVDVEMVGDVIEVSCGESSTSINGTDAAEFPLIPSVETTEAFIVVASLFREALSQVLFSVSTTNIREDMSGVFFKFEGDVLTLAATNGHRLAERRLKLETSVDAKAFIVPAVTLQELTRTLNALKDDVDVEDVLRIGLSESQVVFTYGSAVLSSPIIDREYVDYRQLIADSFSTELIVGRSELIKAVKAASLFSRTGIFDVLLNVGAEGGLTVTASEATRGKNTVSCDADVKGQAIQMLVNYRYLLDGLNAMSSEGVTLKMTDILNPCVLHPNGQSDFGEYLYVVMPLRQ